MNNFYRTLIVATALISVFFFMKWVYEVWPRYEVQERIEEMISYDYWDAEYCQMFQEERCFDVVDWGTGEEVTDPDYCIEVERFDCYYRDEVRVN